MTRRTVETGPRNVLEVADLRIEFNTPLGTVHAVNGLTFDIRPGEIFGLVGESGCGKTVTGLALLGLLPSSSRVTSRRIALNGRELGGRGGSGFRSVRGRHIAMIFQDPGSSLNPVYSIANQMQMIIRNRTGQRRGWRQEALGLLRDVDLSEPDRILRSYPHQLSGGMQQRVMIAMSLASGADLLVADEPTTALDVTTQATILNLLDRLRRDRGLSILLISHNLAVVGAVSDRIGVLYAGTLVEVVGSEGLAAVQHPYSKALLEALPSPEGRGRDLRTIPFQVPSGFEIPVGCPFAPRCRHVMDVCALYLPPPIALGPDHWNVCHLFDPAPKVRLLD